MTAPSVRLTGALSTGAGFTLPVEVAVANAADAPRVLSVSLIGLDPEWGASALLTSVLAPGAAETVSLAVRPPVGTVAGSYPFVVAVQPLDPRSLTAVDQIAQLDAAVVVGAPAPVSLALDPPEPEASHSRRLRIQLANDGEENISLRLTANAGPGLRLRLRRSEVTVPARRTVRVRARVGVEPGRLTGATRRLPFVVTAQGRGAPLQAEGVFVNRPLLRTGLTKFIALLAVLAVWASAAVFGVSALSSHVHKQQTAGVNAAGGANGAGGSSGGSSGGGSGSSGGGGGSGAGGAGGGAVTTSAHTARFNGTVTGPAPGGVTVSLKPTTLVDAAALPATYVGAPTPAANVGKLTAQLIAYQSSTASNLSRALTTTTAADGSWAFAGVPAPGYYLLQFSKAGFQTQRYVLNAGVPTALAPLTVAMSAGAGRISGTVVGPNGPLPGAKVTVSNGSVTVSTGTPTKGAIGTFSVDSLSTPSTYLVSASADGYDTEAKLVALPASGSVKVTLTLHAGVASLAGLVQAPDETGTVAGLGGVTVTATDGQSVTRTASTVTQGPVGDYTLPSLPVPATYTVTFSAPGYLPVTEQVHLDGSTPQQKADVLLAPATATVTGTVTDTTGTGIVAAGLVLTGPAGTYKTMSVSDPAGGFRLDGVAPGSYVLSAEKFGMITNFVTVQVGVGSPAPVAIALTAAPSGGLPATAHIHGTVTDERTGGQITCPTNIKAADCIVTISTVDRRPTGDVPYSVTTAPGVAYTLPPAVNGSTAGLMPGVHILTVSAPGYETATVPVQVPVGATVEAPVITLAPEGSIVGTVTTTVGKVPDGTCVFAVPSTSSTAPATPKCGTAGAAAPTTCTAPANGGCSMVAADGSYQITQLVHGVYWLFAVPSNTDWLPSTPVQLTLALGETKSFNVQLNRLGSLAFTVQVPNAAGQPGPPGGPVSITITGTTTKTSKTVQTDNLNNDDYELLTVTGLPADTYSISASYTDSSTSPATAYHADASATVGLNVTTPVNIVLVPGAAGFAGRVVYLLDGSPVAVPNVQVTVTGIDQYNGSVPVSGSVKVTTGTDGCFAVVPSGSSPPADCGTNPFVVTSGNVGTLNLLTSVVSVSVAAPTGYGDTFQSGLSVQGGQLTVTLTPPVTTMTPVAGTVVASGASDLTKVTVTVTGSPPGVGSVSVTVNSDGSLTWNAPGQTTNQLPPGTYTLSASLPNYDTTTATVNVPVVSTPYLVSVGLLTLPSYTDLKVYSVTGPCTSATDPSTCTPVDGAVFQLSAPHTPTVTETAAPGSDNVTFPNLSTKDHYSVTIQAAGYVFGTFPTGGGYYSVPGSSPAYAQLTRDGAIYGTVQGQIGSQKSPLPGVTVIATSGGATFTAVTDYQGKFLITGTTSQQGLDAGTWQITFTQVTGYTAPAVSPVTITDTSVDTEVSPDPLTFTATQSDLKVHVTDSLGHPIAGASVQVTNSTDLSGSCPPTTAPTPPSCAGTTDTSGYYDAGSVDPDQYSVQVSDANFSPVTLAVTMQPGIAQTVTVPIAALLNTVVVTVQGQAPGSSPISLSDATVSLTPSAGGTAFGPSSKSGNTYTFSGLLADTYTLSVGDTGYVTWTQSVPVSGGQTVTVPVTLFTSSVPVEVDLVADTSLVGGTVTLTGTGTTALTETIGSSGCTGSATYCALFPEAAPSTNYTASAQSSGGQPWGSTTFSTPATASGTYVATNPITVEDLTVTVTTTNGNTTGQATVTIQPTSGSSTVVTVTTNGTGVHVLLPEQDYSVSADLSGYTPQTASVTAGEAKSVSFALAPAAYTLGNLIVTVDDSGGTPVNGASVSFTSCPGSTCPAAGTTSGNGKKAGQVTFTGLQVGTYGVEASYVDPTSGQTVTASDTVAVTSGTVPLTLTLSAPQVASVTVNVVDSSNKAVTGSTVTVSLTCTNCTVPSVVKTTAQTTTGSVQFTELPYGTYTASASYTASGTTYSGTSASFTLPGTSSVTVPTK